METQLRKSTYQAQPSFTNISNIKADKAAKTVGISWVVMFFLSIPTVLLVLEHLVIKGDTEASLSNIQGNESLLYVGIVSYFVILSLDATVAIGLYSILKFVNKKLALVMSLMRLLFVLTTAISLVGLAMLEVDFYSIGVLVGYLFLIPHLFLLGYLTIVSEYLSTPLGIFMVLTSFSYVITMFGEFFLSSSLMVVLNPIAMIPASLGEISMGIYFIIKANRIYQRLNLHD